MYIRGVFLLNKNMTFNHLYSLINENIEAFINQSNKGGSLEGYVVKSSAEQTENYLSSQGANQSVINYIKEKYNTIAFIKNLYVSEKKRGKGFGIELTENAISDAFSNGADAIILISDSSESNSFDLESWYRDIFNFKTISYTSSGPLMILDLES